MGSSSQSLQHFPYLKSMWLRNIFYIFFRKLIKHRKSEFTILNFFYSGILISDPTFEEEQLAAGVISITMEGTSVTHLYKPGNVLF